MSSTPDYRVPAASVASMRDDDLYWALIENACLTWRSLTSSGGLAMRGN